MCIERGLIDLNIVKKNRNHYTMDGKKDKDGAIIPGTSLRSLLDACPDFQNEVSMIEWVAEQYGWRVLFSPKCHPEIAGIGIEYDWATSKNDLNSIPLSDRKGVEKFKDKVLNRCFSRLVLNDTAIRNGARQARGFMIGYRISRFRSLGYSPPDNTVIWCFLVEAVQPKAPLTPLRCLLRNALLKKWKSVKPIEAIFNGY